MQGFLVWCFLQFWRARTTLLRFTAVSLGLRIRCGRGRLSFSSLTSATVSRGWFMTETTWVSFRTLSMWFPLKTFSHFPGNVGFLSFLILGHCSSLNNFVPDSEVLSSHHLINTRSHRSLQRGTVFKFSKRADCSPSRTGSRSKTFPDVPIIFRVSCGNPESRQSMVAHEVHTFG